MHNRLKGVFLLYCASAAVFGAVLAGGIAAKKHADSLSATLAALRQAQANLVRTKQAVEGMRGAIAEIKSAVPPGFDAATAETLLLTGLDALKSRMRDAEIAIGSFDSSGEELFVPVTLRATMKDYAALVNTVGYLQSLRFPFVTITALSLSPANEKEKSVVVYEMKGFMKTPKGKVP
ncbi:MAG: hypothetical protein U0411_03560 [Thermodesulfovibrionales bacterium]